jgi:hypothetical protein
MFAFFGLTLGDRQAHPDGGQSHDADAVRPIATRIGGAITVTTVLIILSRYV